MDIDDVQEMQDEVENFARKIERISKRNRQVKRLFKGTQIYFSELTELPTIMFLGINPGAGYYNWTNRIVKRFYPLDSNEYYDFYFKEDGYTLAKEWGDIFDNGINRLDLLENSVKSNCYFFATSGTKELKQLKNELDGITEEDLESKSQEWNRILLDYVQPYILICEGVSVRDKLYEWYPDEFEMYDDYTGKLSLDSGSIDVLVVKRSYSNIRDKDVVIDELQSLIENCDCDDDDDCDCDDDDDCDCDCDDDDDECDRNSGNSSYVNPITLSAILSRKR